MQVVPDGPVTVDTTEAGRRFEVALEDGATVTVRVHGHGPRLVMSHGNGFAIEAYRPFWRRFVDRHEVVLFDFRHHGLSSPYRGPMRNWQQFVRDLDRILAAVERRLGRAESVGVFHSMSAMTALLHAAQAETPWRALVAFEPPVPPPADRPESEPFFAMHQVLSDGAARRREHFPDVEDLAARFARRDTFRRVPAQTLHGLAAATLRWNPELRRFDLACARDFEAETFRMHHVGDAWERILSVSVPTCLVAGIPGRDENRCLSDVARRIAAEGSFAFHAVADATHFLQMERPRECADAVEAFLSRLAGTAAGARLAPGRG